jgi:uncharacterized membrane protein
VLKPVARKATLSAAKVAVSQGPSLFKDKVAPNAGELKDKLPFVGGGGKGKGKGRAATGTGRGRRLPVQEYVDVAASIDVVYDQFTQFEDFPQFMHRVEKVEQRDDETLMWHENIWGVRRSWEAEITEQEPCERIAWRSKEGVKTTGVVTFHRLADNLTRVYMTVDFQPQGLFEKSASGFRLSRRAIKSDLMRFKAYVEMRDEATGGWRGRIEDGEVVDDEEQSGKEKRGRGGRFRRDEDEREEREESEEPEDAGREEDYADEDDDDYADDEEELEEEQEEEPRPKPRRRSRAKSKSR